MEWDSVDTETYDHHMSDQISLGESNIEPAPITSVTAHTYDSNSPPDPRDGDAISDCTRISLEANETEQGLDEEALAVVPDRQDALDDQARINHAPRSASPEPEADHLSNGNSPSGQQALDTYLAHLRRAQEEQERLEEELEGERLNEELGLSNQAQVPPVDSPQLEERRNSPPLAASNESALQGHPDLEHPAFAPNVNHDQLPVSLHDGQPESTVQNPDQIGATVSPQAQQGLVEIQFWAFERGQWRKSDRLLVDPSDPSPLERVARKYIWKGYSLYDVNLQSLRPAQCFRAATADGENSIFVISDSEERELVAKGRLTKERQLLAMASRALERTEEERPARSVNPREP
jgi:hypothetical protein